MEQTVFNLSQNDIPKQWYNIQADLPRPLKPPIHPKTQQPICPDDLLSNFHQIIDRTGNVT